MGIILNFVYMLVILLASPWLLYCALVKGKYREGFAEKLLGLAPRIDGDVEDDHGKTRVWLHAVSVGEVNLLGTLIDEIQRQHPDWRCLVSTTTITGMRLARKKYPDLTVFYCPLDFTWATRTAMRRVRPHLLLLAELELWPNLIHAARRQGARVAVVNGRLSENSYRGYRRIRPLVAGLLRKIDLIAVQDESYARRFLHLGAKQQSVHLTGSLKYDGAETNRRNPKIIRLRKLAGFADSDVVFLAGSTQEPEEAVALDVFRRLIENRPQLRLVIVPRHPERFDSVARHLDSSGVAWQRRTSLDEGPLNENARVLLVDVVGELGAWWGTADMAFVGGSFGNRGGQNMIEPAAYGAAVSFGPNTRNFRDIVTLMLNHDAAVVVQDGAALERFVRRCLEDPGYAGSLGERAKDLVAQQLGATQRTVELLTGLFSPKTATKGRNAA